MLSSVFQTPTAKNGVYNRLVEVVQEAFTLADLVKIECKGFNPSDYKKIGAKLKVRHNCDPSR